MTKFLIPIFTIIALCVSSCSSKFDGMEDWMYWSHDNQSPENIEYAYMLDAVSQILIEVNYKGGDITLICNNYDNLLPIGADGSNTYDCGCKKTFLIKERANWLDYLCRVSLR